MTTGYWVSTTFLDRVFVIMTEGDRGRGGGGGGGGREKRMSPGGSELKLNDCQKGGTRI